MKAMVNIGAIADKDAVSAIGASAIEIVKLIPEHNRTSDLGERAFDFMEKACSSGNHSSITNCQFYGEPPEPKKKAPKKKSGRS